MWTKIFYMALLSLSLAREICDDSSQFLQLEAKGARSQPTKRRPHRKRNSRAFCGFEGKSALIVVDMQNDFITGSLPVSGGAEIIPTINQLTALEAFDYIFFTQDYHPLNHISFASNSPMNKSAFESIDVTYTDLMKICGNEYKTMYGVQSESECSAKKILTTFKQELWPDHCIQGTRGQRFHDDLNVPERAFVVRKGITSLVDSYGAMWNNIGMHLASDTVRREVERTEENALKDVLVSEDVENVFVLGLAEDYCVKYTALQALSLDFDTYLVTDATKPVSDEGGEEAKDAIVAAGGKLIESCALLGTCACPKL